MTTHGTDRHHSHQHRSTSNEEHPHPPMPNNGRSHPKPNTNGGRDLFWYRPATPYPSPMLADGDSVRGLPLETATWDDLAQVCNGWTVVPNGELCGPNGKIWHPRCFGERYAISTVNEDGALGTTPFVHYAINPQGDPTVYGIFRWDGDVHSKPLKALASSWLGTSHEGHLDWLEGKFTLQALIDLELLNLDDVGVEADIYQLRKAAFNKAKLEEQDQELSWDWAQWYHAKEWVHNRLVKAWVRTHLYDTFKDNKVVPCWPQLHLWRPLIR